MTEILNNTVEMLQAADTVAQNAGADAAQAVCDQYFGGSDGGPCGFAWVTYYPKNKGNTRLGRQERRMIEAAGFRKDWTGKAWQKWNAGGFGGQSIDAKEAACRAYAKEFEVATGVSLSVGSRLD